MENTSLQHVLIQSRITILNLLERRGYDTTPYKKMLGPEMLKLTGEELLRKVNDPEALRMTLQHTKQPEKRAIVEYAFTNIKISVGNLEYINRMLNDPPESESKTKIAQKLFNIDPATTEVIVLYAGKDTSDDKESPYDKGALEAWNKYKFRIQFFPIVRMVFNPLEHVLQPKFEIVDPKDHESLKKEWYIKNFSQLPIIKFHMDMAARCLGLVPMDIVKITSISPSAGEYVKYRICAP
jgi:DNA-directed RNA polymerase subunit H (RpoH/RPB5)